MGLEGTGGFGLRLAVSLRSEPIDFDEEFDATCDNGTFSVESRVLGFEGRAGTWGFVLVGIGGEEPSVGGTSRNREGRPGISGAAFSSVSDSLDFVGRAGT